MARMEPTCRGSISPEMQRTLSNRRKVRFVKQYTNHVGRQFRRYEIDGPEALLDRTIDVCVRPGRNAHPDDTLSNAEATAEATMILRRRLPDCFKCGMYPANVVESISTYPLCGTCVTTHVIEQESK